MRKNKTLLYKRSNSLIRFLLSVMGFGVVCSLGGCEYGTPAVEYGTPHATFKAIGSVKSQTTSNVIPNIRVVMGFDTTFTDESGNYQVANTDFPEDQIFLVEFKDIDGETHGEYQPLDTLVAFINPEFSGGSGAWNSGETEKEVNIQLKEKE